MEQEKCPADAGNVRQGIRVWFRGSFVGVDFSEVALRRAAQRANAETIFVNGAVESFAPEDRFESIVFNELLYYLTDPCGCCAATNGFWHRKVCCWFSLFAKTERIQSIAAEIPKKFKVARHATVANAGGTWDCTC